MIKLMINLGQNQKDQIYWSGQRFKKRDRFFLSRATNVNFSLALFTLPIRGHSPQRNKAPLYTLNLLPYKMLWLTFLEIFFFGIALIINGLGGRDDPSGYSAIFFWGTWQDREPWCQGRLRFREWSGRFGGSRSGDAIFERQVPAVAES
jgi:hypothetical protein